MHANCAKCANVYLSKAFTYLNILLQLCPSSEKIVNIERFDDVIYQIEGAERLYSYSYNVHQVIVILQDKLKIMF